MKAAHTMVARTYPPTPEPDDVFVLTEELAPAVRHFGLLNWRGMGTLAFKEVHRFLKIPGQTLISPLVMTLLFYAVFAMGMGPQAKAGNVSFLAFIIPGLIVISMAQSAFMNTAASLILSKIQENIVDVLMAPLGPIELTIGYAFGGVMRGLLVGGLSYGLLSLLTPLPLAHPLIALFFAIMGTLMLSLMGVLTGIWGDKFDHMGAVLNFVIMPATFLSGTFFTIDSLPESWRFVCTMNPFFYLIDGFRYGFTGTADSFLWGGMALLLIVDLVLFTLAYWMFAHGTFLKK